MAKISDGGSAPRALPWNTPPSDEGFHVCAWCGRAIYSPALPCSVETVPDIAELLQPPCHGDRCLWEMRVRGLLSP